MSCHPGRLQPLTLTSGTYRAADTASIGDSIYVIHAFQKKSKAGIATPKSEIDLIPAPAPAVEK